MADTFPCSHCQKGIPTQYISNLKPGDQFMFCCPHCHGTVSGGVGYNLPGTMAQQQQSWPQANDK